MLLATYLNDHLAGATAGRELAKRAATSNRGSPLGDHLQQLTQEIQQDRQALLELMGSLTIGVDRAKVTLAWTAEKLARLKPNGRLLSYSPLSRLLELEGLTPGIAGKLSLWQALKQIEVREPRLAGASLDELEGRAERQLAELQPHRAHAAEALTPESRT